MNMTPHLGISHTSRAGNWLPSATAVKSWLKRTIEQVERQNKPYAPVIEEFKHLIESDPVLLMYFTQMFEEQPAFQPPEHSGDVKIKNYQQMLAIMNHVLTTAPEFSETDMVGFPINAILDFPMITRAGLAAFADFRVDAMLKKVLGIWTQFLDSPDSCYVLNDTPTGWLCPAALKAIHMEEFVFDPKAPYYGFKSWNDFFIREFKPNMRPVAAPDDPHAIVSACESTPFAISTNVKEQDKFWLKAQPYSLRQMLAGRHVAEFVGGTVYQAFLSAEKYHRWHSPVSGTIKEIVHVDGTYYAEAASEGFDPVGPNNSQGYLAHVAARALIFIEADEPDIGLLCLIPIGMAEVSSCKVTVRAGDHVKKGQQVGYFQFGGSTHCVVFRPGVIADFALQALPQGACGANSANVKINSPLAMATKNKR
jgi:phosphatidylserine decarboxylase